MSESRAAPSEADLVEASQLYSEGRGGPGGSDYEEVYRLPSGEGIQKSWGVDPDHGDYERWRWVPGAELEELVARLRAEHAARYPEEAGAPGGWGLIALTLLVLGGLVALLVARWG